jgi:hypothetical protein
MRGVSNEALSARTCSCVKFVECSRCVTFRSHHQLACRRRPYRVSDGHHECGSVMLSHPTKLPRASSRGRSAARTECSTETESARSPLAPGGPPASRAHDRLGRRRRPHAMDERFQLGVAAVVAGRADFLEQTHRRELGIRGARLLVPSSYWTAQIAAMVQTHHCGEWRLVARL